MEEYEAYGRCSDVIAKIRSMLSDIDEDSMTQAEYTIWQFVNGKPSRPVPDECKKNSEKLA